MQVITWNDSTDNDGVAIYLFDDSKEIVREGDKTTINDANGWQAIPGWIDPRLIEDEILEG